MVHHKVGGSSSIRSVLPLTGHVRRHNYAAQGGVAGNFKGITEMCPRKTHKAPTPMKECKPIKLGGSVVAAQGTAVVTGGNHGKGKKVTKKYLPDYECIWKAQAH